MHEQCDLHPVAAAAGRPHQGSLAPDSACPGLGNANDTSDQTPSRSCSEAWGRRMYASHLGHTLSQSCLCTPHVTLLSATSSVLCICQGVKVSVFAAVLTASLGSHSKALIELSQLCRACHVGKYMNGVWYMYTPPAVFGPGSMRFSVQEHMKQWLCGLKEEF